jgi:hypothetical protein
MEEISNVDTRTIASYNKHFYLVRKHVCEYWYHIPEQDEFHKNWKESGLTINKITFTQLSQPALGWLKVCYDVDKHHSLHSLYRLAIGYFRGGERGEVVESYPSFPCKFGSHSKSLCFWFSLREVVFKLAGRPVGKTAAPIPREATQTPGYVRSQIWFGLGTHLGTVRPRYRTGVPLPSRCCILYIIFSINIRTEYFKHAAHSLFFSSKCRLFHNATFYSSCFIHILHTGCAKI